MNTDTLSLNKSVDQEINVQCRRCIGGTAHKVLANAELAGDDSHTQWQTDYQIVQCMGCKMISFRSESSNSEDVDHDVDEYGQWNSTYAIVEKLYPPRIAGYVGLVDDVWLLPEKLRRIYQETSTALIADQPVLTGIGVRAILETLCKDKAAQGHNLFNQIDDLVKQGVLTPARAGVLHQIRTLGNQSAHEVEPHTPAQLGLAMTVLDHLLEEVYVLPQKAQRLFAPLPAATTAAHAPTLAPPPFAPGIAGTIPSLPVAAVVPAPHIY